MSASVTEIDQSLSSISLSGELNRFHAPEKQARKSHNVTFTNCAAGLGIKIIGGVFEPEEGENEDDDRDFGIFIRKILPEGVASSDGRLKEGDQILSVNGHSLEAVTNNEAVIFLRQASMEDYVSLTITRDHIAREDFTELIHAYTYSTATSMNGSSLNSRASSPGPPSLTPLPIDNLPPVPYGTHPHSSKSPTITESQLSQLLVPMHQQDLSLMEPTSSSTPVLTPTSVLLIKETSAANSENSTPHRMHSPPDGASSLFSYVPQAAASPTHSPAPRTKVPSLVPAKPARPIEKAKPEPTRAAKQTNTPSLNPNARISIEKLETALQYLGIQPTAEEHRELCNRLKAENDGTVQYGDFVKVARDLFQKQLEAQKFQPASKLKSHSPQVPSIRSPKLSPSIPMQTIGDTSEREKALLQTEIARLKGALRDNELKYFELEDELYKVRKAANRLADDNHSLRSKVHIAEQAQRAARTTEQDYEQVLKLLENEVAELRAHHQQMAAAPAPQEIPDIQRRLAVLGCQLRKAEASKKTYEVATDKLLQFSQKVNEKLSASKSAMVRNMSKEAGEVTKAVKNLIEVDALPFGWEEAYSSEGIKHYINHVTQQTSWQHPVTKVVHTNAASRKAPPPISPYRVGNLKMGR